MSSNNYRWIGTDRRSDAEILREIAEADTPLVIVSREDSGALEKTLEVSRQLIRGNDATLNFVTLYEPSKAEQTSPLSFTANWVGKLSLLVTPPCSFGVIAISIPNLRKSIAESQATGFWDWIISLDEGGTIISRIPSNPVVESQAMRDAAAHKLVPIPAKISPIVRRRIHDLAGIYSTDEPDDIALKAGLFQWHDALDESHECSQSIEGRGRHRAGDYWHAIMHRREPDYGNSKYWFRHVGSHPIFPELGRRAEPLIAAAAPEWRDRLLKNGWDPFAFVDFCELAAAGKNPQWTELAEKIQELEMLLLLASTYEDARYSNHSERGASAP